MEKNKVKEVYYHGKCTMKEKRVVMVHFCHGSEAYSLHTQNSPPLDARNTK